MRKGLLFYGGLGLGVFALVGVIMRSDTPGDEDSARSRVVEIARQALAQPPSVSEIWADTAPSLVGTTAAWCGGLALWVLHRAGLMLGVPWEVGKGFAYRLSRVGRPRPGDIAYFDQPFQHHAIVVDVQDNTFTSIDGNQPGILERNRMIGDATAFYSISPAIKAAGV